MGVENPPRQSPQSGVGSLPRAAAAGIMSRHDPRLPAHKQETREHGGGGGGSSSINQGLREEKDPRAPRDSSNPSGAVVA